MGMAGPSALPWGKDMAADDLSHHSPSPTPLQRLGLNPSLPSLRSESAQPRGWVYNRLSVCLP